MQILAEFIGYVVIILGLLAVGLFFLTKALDYIPTPRRWIYKKIGQLAKDEPDVFLNTVIYFKRKYNLKNKK